MGDEEAKDTMGDDTQQAGDSPESTRAAPAQEPADSAAAPAADETTATSAKPEDTTSSPEKDNTPAAPATPVQADNDDDETNKKAPAADENTAATDDDADDPAKAAAPAGKLVPIVASSKKSRPPYKYDPNKISLRFIFANRDGLTVTVDCNPSDTVGEVKGALLSVWPEGTLMRLSSVESMGNVGVQRRMVLLYGAVFYNRPFPIPLESAAPFRLLLLTMTFCLSFFCLKIYQIAMVESICD